MAVSTSDKLCKNICDALGLKNVVKLDISLEVGNLVRVTVEYFPDRNNVKELIPVLKRMKMEDINPASKERVLRRMDLVDTTVIGDEWSSCSIERRDNGKQ